MSRITRNLAVALVLSCFASVGIAQAGGKDAQIQVFRSGQHLMGFVQPDASIPQIPGTDPRYSWDEVERDSVKSERCGKQVPPKDRRCVVSSCVPGLVFCRW